VANPAVNRRGTKFPRLEAQEGKKGSWTSRIGKERQYERNPKEKKASAKGFDFNHGEEFKAKTRANNSEQLTA